LDVRLRAVVEEDLDVLYAHQLDPEATGMASFPARDEASFRAHWAKILADDGVVAKTILYGSDVAGNIVAWEEESGRLLVGYWIGRDFWGKGIATAALSQLLAQLTRRPLHARVASGNVGSVRVLEKCGFKAVGSEVEVDETFGEIAETLFELE